MEDKITLNISNSIKHEPCDTTFAAEFLRLSSDREITKEHALPKCRNFERLGVSKVILDDIVNVNLSREKY